MTEILSALATSAAVMLPVIIFALFATMAAVRRAEAEAHHPPGFGTAHAHAAEATAAGSAAAAAAAAPPRDLSVLEIILLAVALFTLAMLAMLGVSLLGHM